MTAANRYHQPTSQDFSKEVRTRKDFFVYQDQDGAYGFNWMGFYEGEVGEKLLSDVKIVLRNRTVEDAINIYAELSAP